MEFTPWPKIGRHFRDIVITEKIDGTNAAIRIVEGVPHDSDDDLVATCWTDTGLYSLYAQSRNRLITPVKGKDNAFFAAWVGAHYRPLVELLGPGIHFGEWWGKGIQRGYGRDDKTFSLFNTHRYHDIGILSDGLLQVVPTLWIGPNAEDHIVGALETLRHSGSLAAPGFMDPEGIVIFHSATGTMTKVTLEGDHKPKGQA